MTKYLYNVHIIMDSPAVIFNIFPLATEKWLSKMLMWVTRTQKQRTPHDVIYKMSFLIVVLVSLFFRTIIDSCHWRLKKEILKSIWIFFLLIFIDKKKSRMKSILYKIFIMGGQSVSRLSSCFRILLELAALQYSPP